MGALGHQDRATWPDASSRRLAWRWRDSGLTAKLIMPVGLSFMGMAVAITALFITGSRSHMLDSLHLRSAILVQPLAVGLSDPVVTRDRQRVQQLVDEAGKADRDVLYALVLDANGLVLAATDAAQVGQTLLRDDYERSLLKVERLERRAAPGASGAFETVAPITYAVLGKVGILRVGVSTASVDAAIRRTAIQAALTTLLALAVGVTVCLLATRRIVRPVGTAAQGLRELATGAADLSRRLEARSRDECGVLAESFNLFMDKLSGIIGSVRVTATHVTGASQQLSGATTQLASGTQQQAASLEETAASLEEITATVKQNADNARQASQLAGGSRDAAERGGQVVAAAVASMQEITQASRKIADIITVIDEIAFQTNLLALNAAVEAARAGEQGRGFAVVAAEVRNLAQRSAGAAKEIKTLIQDSVAKVSEGSDLVNKSGKTLEDIVQSAKRVADIVAEIAAACQEQSGGIDQVNRAVAQMDRVTQDNAAQTEELSSTSHALAEQAHEMLALVSRFTLPEASGHGPSSVSSPAWQEAGLLRPAAASEGPGRTPRRERGPRKPIQTPQPVEAFEEF
jgi:methyl-accepting chemotaxis protein